jgi:hypothetical protein
MQVWTTFVAFIASKQWMPVAIIAIGYLVRLTSQNSKFPINVSTRWQPVIVVALGQVYAVLVAVSSGARWDLAIEHGLETAAWTMGLFDLVVKAIWNGTEPTWLSMLWGFVQPMIPHPGTTKTTTMVAIQQTVKTTPALPPGTKMCQKCNVTWTAPPGACPKCGETPTDPELTGPRKSSPPL